MQISIDNAAAIGMVVRASRKAQKIRQDDAAGSIGVSENFLGKIPPRTMRSPPSTGFNSLL